MRNFFNTARVVTYMSQLMSAKPLQDLGIRIPPMCYLFIWWLGAGEQYDPMPALQSHIILLSNNNQRQIGRILVIKKKKSKFVNRILWKSLAVFIVIPSGLSLSISTKIAIEILKIILSFWNWCKSQLMIQCKHEEETRGHFFTFAC